MRPAAFLMMAMVLAGCIATPPRTSLLLPPLLDLDQPGASWPNYHVNLTGTRFAWAETNVTGATVARLAQAWVLPLGGAATGTPIVAEGKVFVGDWSGKVTAADARGGAKVWEANATAPVTNTLAYADGSVFVGDGRAWLHRLNASTGASQWSVLLDPTPEAHLWGSPVVHDGTLYIGIGSGQENLRRYPDPNPLTFHGSVVAVDAATGQLKWRTYTQRPGLDGAGASVWGTPVLDAENGTLYVGTGNAYTWPDGPYVDALLALDLGSGAVRWAFKATEGDVFTQRMPRGERGPDHDFGSSPVLWEGIVVAAQKSSVLWARDASTGEAVWRNGEPSQGEGVIASPALKDGVLFAPFMQKRLVRAIALANGSTLWEQPVGAVVHSAPAIVPGAVLVGLTSGHLVALDEGTGRELLRAPTGHGGISGGVSVAGGVVYTGTVPKGLLAPEGALIAWAPA